MEHFDSLAPNGPDLPDPGRRQASARRSAVVHRAPTQAPLPQALGGLAGTLPDHLIRDHTLEVLPPKENSLSPPG